ncbi:MAG: amidohydrolase [Lachnospiraceae bacterium]|nr:amidohydrolase [Ruminococcus sp.]MCM1275121.1 amidohydrolase [Lachnospiraceae bacterium]
MKLRFYNAKILTMESENIIEGELCTDGGGISYVGAERASSGYDREIDLGGNLIIPGFKNAHTHSAMTFLRSLADDLTLNDWLYKQVFPREAKLTEEAVYVYTQLANMEYLTSGITSSFDMYMKLPAYVKACRDMGYRTVLCGSINDFGGTVEGIEEEFNTYNNSGELISYQLGFHAEYTTKRETLEGLAELSRKLKAPLYAHNSETRAEVEGCRERYGMSPTQLFDRLGMFEYGGGGFHCVWFDERDMEIFAEKGLWAVTNPASNLKLASGIAPICEMRRHGMTNFAIGTDGAASNNCLDMFREMFLVAGLQKFREENAAACPAFEVLEMATKGGALAMGLTDCDVLKEGKRADFAVIDLKQPNMRPLNNIAKNLVYSGSKQNVTMTVVNGQILYENGKFPTVDSERIYAEAERLTSLFVL